CRSLSVAKGQRQAFSGGNVGRPPPHPAILAAHQRKTALQHGTIADALEHASDAVEPPADLRNPYRLRLHKAPPQRLVAPRQRRDAFAQPARTQLGRSAKELLAVLLQVAAQGMAEALGR